MELLGRKSYKFDDIIAEGKAAGKDIDPVWKVDAACDLHV